MPTNEELKIKAGDYVIHPYVSGPMFVDKVSEDGGEPYVGSFSWNGGMLCCAPARDFVKLTAEQADTWFQYSERAREQSEVDSSRPRFIPYSEEEDDAD